MGEANMHYAMREFDDAEALLLEVVQANSGVPDPHHTLALIYEEQGRSKEALEHFSAAARLTRDNTGSKDMWKKIAQMHRDMGNLQDAIKCFTTAIRLDSSDLESKQDRAGLYGELKQHKKAISAYDQLLKKTPDDVSIALKMAEECFHDEQHPRAIKVLTATLETRWDIEMDEEMESARGAAQGRRRDAAMAVAAAAATAAADGEVLAHPSATAGSSSSSSSASSSSSSPAPDMSDFHAVNMLAELLMESRNYSNASSLITICASRMASGDTSSSGGGHGAAAAALPADLAVKLGICDVYLEDFGAAAELLDIVKRLDRVEFNDLYVEAFDAFIATREWTRGLELFEHTVAGLSPSRNDDGSSTRGSQIYEDQSMCLRRAKCHHGLNQLDEAQALYRAVLQPIDSGTAGLSGGQSQTSTREKINETARALAQILSQRGDKEESKAITDRYVKISHRGAAKKGRKAAKPASTTTRKRAKAGGGSGGKKSGGAGGASKQSTAGGKASDRTGEGTGSSSSFSSSSSSSSASASASASIKAGVSALLAHVSTARECRRQGLTAAEAALGSTSAGVGTVGAHGAAGAASTIDAVGDAGAAGIDVAASTAGVAGAAGTGGTIGSRSSGLWNAVDREFVVRCLPIVVASLRLLDAHSSDRKRRPFYGRSVVGGTKWRSGGIDGVGAVDQALVGGRASTASMPEDMTPDNLVVLVADAAVDTVRAVLTVACTGRMPAADAVEWTQVEGAEEERVRASLALALVLKGDDKCPAAAMDENQVCILLVDIVQALSTGPKAMLVIAASLLAQLIELKPRIRITGTDATHLRVVLLLCLVQWDMRDNDGGSCSSGSSSGGRGGGSNGVSNGSDVGAACEGVDLQGQEGVSDADRREIHVIGYVSSENSSFDRVELESTNMRTLLQQFPNSPSILRLFFVGATRPDAATDCSLQGSQRILHFVRKRALTRGEGEDGGAESSARSLSSGGGVGSARSTLGKRRDPRALASGMRSMLLAHNMAMSETHDKALIHYMGAIDKLKGDTPLLQLCLAVSFLGASAKRTARDPQGLIMHCFSCLQSYKEQRQRQTSERLSRDGSVASSTDMSVTGHDVIEQEIWYNFGRALHQAGLLHLAIPCYQRVLCDAQKVDDAAEDAAAAAAAVEDADGAITLGRGTRGRPSGSELSLRRESAYQLALVYRETGSPGIARSIIRQHLSV